MSSQTVQELMREANRLRFERPQDARRLYSEAVERCRPMHLRPELIRALKGLGQIDRDLNNRERALSSYQEAVIICREEGDPLLLAHTLRHVGDIFQDNGQDELAGPYYEEALSIYRRHDQTLPLDLANAVRPLALLKEKANHFEEAKRLWTEARDLYASVNVPKGVAECSARLARLES